jgi:hypothetical protein
MRQRRAAAGNGLGNCLGTTVKYVRRTASGAAGNGLGTMIKWHRGHRPGRHDQHRTFNKYAKRPQAAKYHSARRRAE